ncbi:unnamed protein product (macronuclear) [Paramecium tetraurelia]|uniref:Transmembrane protein n=1 Tax=Paramecium tetraurelia TaxID=5888 RepID=A0CHR3_PARTE|nr:uncharacterized protein GSPATT00038432001 [Paramecium tetraurelia]CAK70330.1 unnamed protein product [Paramecium tetraurelia]|eukprot:XP_001437727.1 hypothetical protein (macronuclear) [Paramecium tetraurelia strain d4-2]
MQFCIIKYLIIIYYTFQLKHLFLIKDSIKLFLRQLLLMQINYYYRYNQMQYLRIKQIWLYQQINRRQCQFKDEQHQCIENTNDQIGCLDSLNKQACISQKQTCKFENNICSLHQVNTINDIINSTLLFVYSKSVCYAIDQQITDCLIYSEIQNRCINVSNRQPFIDNCYKFTMNKYACLQKTLQTCEYNQNENSCIQTSQQTLKTINNCFPEKYLNWISCISLPSNCKFNGIKCQSIDLKVDTCESLSKSKIYSQSFSLCNYK